MLNQLDHARSYRIKDSTETWWTFAWESIENFAGWQAYRRRPRDSAFFGQGFWRESDVIRWMGEQPSRLTEDDLIDSVLWLREGGLESLFHTIGLTGEVDRA